MWCFSIAFSANKKAASCRKPLVNSAFFGSTSLNSFSSLASSCLYSSSLFTSPTSLLLPLPHRCISKYFPTVNMNWLNLTWFQRGSKNFWRNSNFGPRVKDDFQPPAHSAYRQFPQGGWCYGARNQPAAAEGIPPPSENFPQRPNLSTACNMRSRTEQAQLATERATGTRPASA